MSAANPLTTQPDLPQAHHRAKHSFIVAMIGLATLIVLTGFAPTFYLGSVFQAPPVPTLLIIHGIVFTAWLGLAITQSWLIRSDRVGLHRQLGVLAAAVAVAMVVLGVAAAIESVHSSPWPQRFNLDPLVFMIIPLTQITIFATLVTAAIAMRRKPDAHKRLMLLAIINLCPPAISRIGYNIFHTETPLIVAGVLSALVVACIVYDWRTRGRVHPVFGIIGPITVLTFPLRMAFASTDAWMSFAKWLTS